MSRTHNTEPKVAVHAAQELFWKHGFCDLGTRQIEEETGLTRFTLQKTYGGKKALFLKTLDDYINNIGVHLLPKDGPRGLEELAQWFEWRVGTGMPKITDHGCLMVNTIVEFHGEDQEINIRRDKFQKMIKQYIESHLAVGLNSKTEIREKTVILAGVTLALNVIIRAATDRKAGKPLAQATAKMIREWDKLA